MNGNVQIVGIDNRAGLANLAMPAREEYPFIFILLQHYRYIKYLSIFGDQLIVPRPSNLHIIIDANKANTYI